jgi:hypothetical protein
VLSLLDISTLIKESILRYISNYRSGVVLLKDRSALPLNMPERLFRSVSLKGLIDLSKMIMIDLSEGSYKILKSSLLKQRQ